MNTIKEFERIREWATNRGLYAKGDVKTQFVKLSEEFGEVAKAIINNDDKELKDGIGDMVVVLTNLAHLAGTSIEECMELAWNEIKNRKGSMQNGSFVKEVATAEEIVEWYSCIGLDEVNMRDWAKYFTIGKQYRKINVYTASQTIKLVSDNGKGFYVDESQFKFLPF